MLPVAPMLMHAIYCIRLMVGSHVLDLGFRPAVVVTTLLLQAIDHPLSVTEPSVYHSINTNPVFDVTWLGIVDPEKESSVLDCEQSIAMQLEMVTASQQDSVASEINCSVIEDALWGAIIPDMRSLLE